MGSMVGQVCLLCPPPPSPHTTHSSPCTGPPGMGPMGPRMSGPRGQGPMGPMNPNYAGMRPPPPNANMGPVGPGLPPMPMGAGGRPWQPNPSNMNFSSPSPGSHYGGPGPGNGPPGPGTPILPSPQGSTGPYSPASHRMGTPNAGRDSANPAADGMYPMMKQGPNMPGVSCHRPPDPIASNPCH